MQGLGSSELAVRFKELIKIGKVEVIRMNA